MKKFPITALIMILVGAVGAGCMLRDTPPKTYILSAARGSAATGSPEGPVVGVGPVAVPAYLDRRSIVTHEADGEVRIASNHQWAEPLKDGVTRVVAENLSTMIPTDAALVYPWRSPRAVTYRVTLEIFRFDGTLGGPVVLNARWRLLDKDGNELAFRTVTLEERPVEATYAAFVASHSHLLATVSQDIATAIRTRTAGWVPSSAVLVAGGAAGSSAGGLRAEAGTQFGLGVTVAALAIPAAVGLVPIRAGHISASGGHRSTRSVTRTRPRPASPCDAVSSRRVGARPIRWRHRPRRASAEGTRPNSGRSGRPDLPSRESGAVCSHSASVRRAICDFSPGVRAVRLGPRRGTVRRPAPRDERARVAERAGVKDAGK